MFDAVDRVDKQQQRNNKILEKLSDLDAKDIDLVLNFLIAVVEKDEFMPLNSAESTLISIFFN